MESYLNNIFDKLWDQYAQLNPHVTKIKTSIEQKVGKPVSNDHVAFRTFRHPLLGLQQLAQPFLDQGYKVGGEYNFKQKKLYAQHFEHVEDPTLPKVFISELKIEECSKELQSWVNELLAPLEEKNLAGEELLWSGRIWSSPRYEDYQKFYSESEYAAWLSVFGFCANHFTVFINDLGELAQIEAINEFLEQEGYNLNASGGKVKGTAQDFLEQSSTMAHDLEVEFAQGEKHIVPTVYYEFAKRYPQDTGELYQGFVAKSADKIFESTHSHS